MQINRALLESSDIAKHFMTAKERQVRKALCRLLIDKGHRKYAERLWKLDFNIVDSSKHPEFTAAISFDEATVFISDGFLGGSEFIFNQLDVLLRHELAHNLMMHQIRMMYVFKKLHANDPEEAYEHIRSSASLHGLLNWLEDFEISNKRYTEADKKIVRNMTLNGRIIGGLVTEDHREDWADMPLESMYDEISKELIQINSDIRSNPNWAPTKGTWDNTIDGLKSQGAQLIAMYKDAQKPSSIRVPIDKFIETKTFKSYGEVFQKLTKTLWNNLKDVSQSSPSALLDIVKDISETSPQETFTVINPETGETVCTLYTPEDKMLTNDILKNLGGNINYNPKKYTVKRKTHSQSYKDAWNKIIKGLDTKKIDDTTLEQVYNQIKNL